MATIRVSNLLLNLTTIIMKRWGKNIIYIYEKIV